MQDIMPPPGANAQVIQSYGASSFRIGNQEYPYPVLVMPEQTSRFITNDGTRLIDKLTCIDEARIAAQKGCRCLDV